MCILKMKSIQFLSFKFQFYYLRESIYVEYEKKLQKNVFKLILQLYPKEKIEYLSRNQFSVGEVLSDVNPNT